MFWHQVEFISHLEIELKMDENRNAWMAMVMLILIVVLVALIEAVYRIGMEMRLHVNQIHACTHLTQIPCIFECNQLFIACSQQSSRQLLNILPDRLGAQWWSGHSIPWLYVLHCTKLQYKMNGTGILLK